MILSNQNEAHVKAHGYYEFYHGEKVGIDYEHDEDYKEILPIFQKFQFIEVFNSNFISNLLLNIERYNARA